MTVHVGVTGHRRLADPGAVSAAVDAALADLCPMGHGDRVVVVSGLAEGADRLVVDLVLARPPAQLHAILPLPADDYRTDFPGTATAFDDYLRRAVRVDVACAAGTDREQAYEAAGRAMVDASDVLIAVWDGLPAAGRGGTAEIVEYARGHDVEVRVVPAERPADPSPGTPTSPSEPPCP